MRKLVVLKLDGDLHLGVQVTLEIGEEGKRPTTEITGKLPSNRLVRKFATRSESGFGQC